MSLLLTLFLLVGCSSPTGPSVPESHADAPTRPPRPQCAKGGFRVDVLDVIDAMPNGTLEAQREQLRDVVWLATLGRQAKPGEEEAVLVGAADQLLLRDDALAHVLPSAVGPVRSATMKNGAVVVMVDHDARDRMTSSILEAIDGEAFHLGKLPERVLTFWYDFDPYTAEAQVCPLDEMKRADLESASSGYRTATVKSTEDLAAFLEGGRDLLTAQCTAEGLRLSGRTRPRSTKFPVTVDHVAAITKLPGQRYVDPKLMGRSVDALPREERDDLRRAAMEMDMLLASGSAATNGSLGGEASFIHQIITWRKAHPKVPTIDLLLSARAQGDVEGGTGFSLDPSITAEAATRGLDETLQALGTVPDAVAFFKKYDALNAKFVEKKLDRHGEAGLAEVRALLQLKRAEVQGRSSDDIQNTLKIRDGFSSMAGVASSASWLVYARGAEQCARYDGPLADTAAGNTLFYTDTLAKLWIVPSHERFFGEANTPWRGPPAPSVFGFEPVSGRTLSTASCAEPVKANTRIWFGLRRESIARSLAGLRFNPNAARIFARGADMAGGTESEPNAELAAYIRWWDQHFTAVATWEPQFEVLNQLMKWSATAQQMAIEGSDCLRFLDEVMPAHDRPFDTWIGATRDLRWKTPPTFLKKKPVHCIPILVSAPYSSCGGAQTLVGGVSAATRAEVRAKPVLPSETSPEIARFGGEARAVVKKPGHIVFDTVRKGAGELSKVEIETAPRTAVFRARIEASGSQRAQSRAWAPSNPVRTIEQRFEGQRDGFVARQQINGAITSELRVSDLHAARVHVNLSPSNETVAQQIVDRMGGDGVAIEVAAASLPPDLRSRQLSSGGVIVRLPTTDGAARFLVMQSGPGARGPPGALSTFDAGVPYGGPYANAKGAPRDPVLTVSSMPESAGDALFAHGKEIDTGSAALRAVESAAKAGKLDEAVKLALESPFAIVHEKTAELLLEKGDARRLNAFTKNVIAKAKRAGDLVPIRAKIRDALVRAERRGESTQELRALDARLQLAERALATEGTKAQHLRAAMRGDMPWYAPSTYPADAALPPAAHPAGAALPPDMRFVSRILDVDETPAALQLGEQRYKRRDGDHASKGPLTGEQSASAHGSARRLLFPVRRIAVVLSCDDAEASGKPRCTEAKDEAERVDILMRFQRALAKCDVDGDGRITTEAEDSCMKKELPELRAPAAP